MIKESYIYFLTNTNNKVLYIGVTNNLLRRVSEHKGKVKKCFTSRYNCDRLVYYETFLSITQAISREKQLKNWRREWKNNLVNTMNAEWKDLSEDIGLDKEYIDKVKKMYSKE